MEHTVVQNKVLCKKGTFFMNGKIKWFNNRKGYGFISGEDGNEVFVHYSGINGEGYKTLATGQEVSYDVTRDANDRTIAVNVSAKA